MKQIFFYLNDEFFNDAHEVKNEMIKMTFDSYAEVDDFVASKYDSETYSNPSGAYRTFETAIPILDMLSNEEINIYNIHIGTTQIKTNEETLKPSSYWYGVSCVNNILLNNFKDYMDLGCDELFEVSQVKYDEFLNSEFNIAESSEMDGIMNYLKHNHAI